MKFSFALLAPALLLAACAQKTTPTAVTSIPTVSQPPARLLNNANDSVSYAIGVNVGGALKSQGMDSVNVEALAKGIRGALGKDSLLMDDNAANMFLQNFFQGRQQRLAEANKKSGEQFLATNKTKEGVVTTASGLQYQVLKEGTGAKPTATDRVTVHYTGTTLDGKKFDSSVDRGAPATFPVNGVIPGWTEALQLMKAGSKYKLFIPADLAYGDTGSGPSIPPNSVLIFEVELISVEKGK